MVTTQVKAMKYGIHFTLPTGDTYSIGWWQIDKDGFPYWHNHLKEKTWFTDELSRKFSDLCYEHSLVEA